MERLTPLRDDMSIVFDHVGLAVPDARAAVAFYSGALGLRLVRGPDRVDASHPAAPSFRALYGASWTGCEVAHMLDASGRGLELFEFLQEGEPVESTSDPTEFWRRPGLFHFALHCVDVPGRLAGVERAGGTVLVGPIRTPRLEVCYVSDPWGNVFELVDTPYDVAQGSASRPRRPGER